MPLEIAVTLLIVAVLLVASAFFSCSETALTAASRARLHALEAEGNASAARVNRMLRAPERIIGTILVANNLVNIMAASLTTGLLITLFGEIGVVYSTIGITALVVVFSEVLPKTYAMAYADRVSLAVAPLIDVLITLLRPITASVELIVRLVLRATPNHVDDDANILAHKEIRGTIELQHKEGAVARHDADMLGGVLDLGELGVADIMVHRTKMETLDIDTPPAGIIDAVVKGQYTRIPLWKDEPENIVGILHTKDLLAVLSKQGQEASKIDIAALAQAPWFVPDATSVKDQLNAFLKRRTQMALVVDEYGEVQGLITLEDILEEIVGQISDEHDTNDASIRLQADGSVNVDGATPVRDLNRHMGWDLPDEEATTIAGLVIHEAQTIPDPGQTFTFYGYRFEILRRNRNKLTALRIKPLATTTITAGARPQKPRPANESEGMEGG